MSNAICDAALRYAHMGLAVIPLHGKRPFLPAWPEMATTDKTLIEKWWHQDPTANVGIATGPKSHLFVVDVDPKNGGQESIDTLFTKYGRFPSTWQQITGSGGNHFFFRYPTFPVGNKAGLMPGIDIRGEGGQVVAPPSLHPETNRRYMWDGLREPWEEPDALAEAPPWLLEILQSHVTAKAPEQIAQKIPKGVQHANLVSMAGRMRRMGLTEDEIFPSLMQINVERCEQPGPEAHIRQIAHSMMRYEPHDRSLYNRGDSVNHMIPDREMKVATRAVAANPMPSSKSKSPSIAAAWRNRLILSERGKPRPVVANALIALRYAPEWQGVLWFDESSYNTVAKARPPWEESPPVPFVWRDEDDVRTAAWLQHQGILASKETAGQAVQTIAREHGFHPVRDYLNSLNWDRVPRVNDWLTLYLGVDPTEYVRAAGSKWLIGAVARVFKPGCKCDCCLILEGPQGTLKSTALRTLGEPWFTDDMPELGTKDASLQTRGVWIVELSELDSMGRADVNKIKAFMSRATDRFRPPFGRRPIEAPRECIFAGTVNHSSYLRDETGGRRFWPVKCGLVKIDELRRDRDQLWAEARDLFRAGSNWWLDEKRIIEAAAEQQEERYEGDPWDGLIASYVDGKENVTIEGILSAALEKERGQWTQTDKNRISRSLKMLGWERYQHRQGSNREWRYRLVTSLL